MRLDQETPSAMMREAFSIPYDAYQLDLWQHLVAGTAIGAALALAVVFVAMGVAGARRPETPFERYSKSINAWQRAHDLRRLKP